MEAQQKVGPYVLVRKLGEGGMGFVHLARDESGRQVALKMMRPELAARVDIDMGPLGLVRNVAVTPS